MSPNPGLSCDVRQHPSDLDVWFFDFDPASPGGRGGASVVLDASIGLVSIAGVHCNVWLPKRSTGGLIAVGLLQTPLRQPTIIEAYNVEASTKYNLRNGGDGQGTVIGNLLCDIVDAVGGTIDRWETIAAGGGFHLRVHVMYP